MACPPPRSPTTRWAFASASCRSAIPLPVRALLDRAAANRAVVQALAAKQDPAILEVRAEGLAQAIVTLCTVLDIPLDTERRAFLRALDIASLEALLTTIGVQHRWP